MYNDRKSYQSNSIPKFFSTRSLETLLIQQQSSDSYNLQSCFTSGSGGERIIHRLINQSINQSLSKKGIHESIHLCKQISYSIKGGGEEEEVSKHGVDVGTNQRRKRRMAP
jgi:hypothetical protein